MPQPPALMPLSEADYDAIQDAVMETMRGRWFLAEYARRNRHADTKVLLAALDRIETSITSGRPAEPDSRIRVDIVEMSQAIARTKAEIAAIKPDSEHHGKFGEATEELDSIVLATESATSQILAAAEQIQETAWTLREQGLDPTTCDLIDARATDLYTACSFQDLTGQRTRKIIQVLRYLEGRINAMIDIWGPGGTEHAARAGAAAPPPSLLNGPSRPGHGLDQGDVDMVMGPAAAADSTAARPAEAEIEPVTAAPPMEAGHAGSPPVAEAASEPDTLASTLDEQTPPGMAPDPAAPALEPEGDTQASPPLQPGDTGSAVDEPALAGDTPRRRDDEAAGRDPLASFNALSADEKIALFS
jgi:chemotaxis protein CheZ